MENSQALRGAQKPPEQAQFYKMYVEGKTNDIDSTPETAEDYLAKCRWVYSLYCAGTLLTKPGAVKASRSLGELRQYAHGAQPYQKYEQQIDRVMNNGSNPELSQKFNFKNISWANTMIYSKFRNIAVAKICAPEFDPTIVATDTYSNAERNMRIAMDKLGMLPQMQALDQQTGIAPDVTAIAQSMGGDIDAAVSIGSYLLPVEAMFQDAIRVTFDNSSWIDIKPMLGQDIVDYGFAAVDTNFCDKEKTMKVEYVSPEGLIVPASNYQDCRDIPFAAYLKHVRVSELRQEAFEDDTDPETEKKLYKIAKQYGSYYPNIPMRNANKNFNDINFRRDYAVANHRQVYDSYTVMVMVMKFIACEVIDGVEIQSVFKCKWVVGTDCVYDFEKDDAIGRIGGDGNKKACLPIIVYCVSGPSITEKAIPHIDDMQLSVLKLRALISNLPPGMRRAIDLSKMRNSVNLGEGKNYDILDLLAVERNTGTLVYESRGEFDEGQPSQSSPITTMQSGILEDINIHQNIIISAIDMIRQVTGLNEVADGSTQTRDLGIGVMQGMQDISNTAISPEFDSMRSLFARTASNMASRYQAAVLTNEIELTSIRMTASGLHMIKLTKDIALREIGVMCKPMPNQSEIDLIIQQVVAKVQGNELSQADMTIIISMLKGRNVYAASMFMAKAIQQFRQQAQAQAESAMVAQEKAQGELAQIQEAAKQKTLQMKAKAEMDKMMLGHKLDLEKMTKASEIGVNSKAFEIAAGKIAIS